jgi:arginyl-tRNA synthetase
MPYALETAKAQIIDLLRRACGSSDFEMKTPPPNVDADLAVPLFRVAKEGGKNPAQLAGEVAAGLDLEGTLLTSVSTTGGFVNFKLAEDRFATAVLEDFRSRGEDYGRSQIGAGKTVVIDYSSPNIAKPFSVGHLRSTVIGQAIANILRFLGYTVVGDNHIGDWGTQFGKLLYAYEVWGDEEKVAERPIQEFLALYVKFHEEAESDPEIERHARAWFKRLEEGEAEAVRLWTWFRELSLREFQHTYQLLGVEFDEVLGESFYNDRLKDVVDDAFRSGVARWGEVPRRPGETEPATASATGSDTPGGAAGQDTEKVALIDLEAHGIDTPLLIQKSDGTSLYATRDLATLRYRWERWQPTEILYVVGGEQKLYFQQVFQAAALLGYEAPCTHVPFGLIRLPKGRMSTRKGRVIFLEDVLNEAIQRAEAVLEDRDLSVVEKKGIARMVGVGSVKYADLSQTRTKDVLFDWDKMLNMQGDSAPYLQYAAVRVRSIERKAEAQGIEIGDPAAAHLTEPAALGLVKTLARFPEAVRQAADGYYPHVIATYLIDVARDFSTFYNQVPVLRADNPDLVAARLELCRMTAQVLENGLALLGIEVPERM